MYVILGGNRTLNQKLRLARSWLKVKILFSNHQNFLPTLLINYSSKCLNLDNWPELEFHRVGMVFYNLLTHWELFQTDRTCILAQKGQSFRHPHGRSQQKLIWMKILNIFKQKLTAALLPERTKAKSNPRNFMAASRWKKTGYQTLKKLLYVFLGFLIRFEVVKTKVVITIDFADEISTRLITIEKVFFLIKRFHFLLTLFLC